MCIPVIKVSALAEGRSGCLGYGCYDLGGGGLDFGRQVDDHCFTVDAPNQPRDINGSTGVTTWNGYQPSGTGMCRVVTSWMNNLDARFHGSVPFKGGFTGSFIYRNTPGAEQSALLTVTSADVKFKNPARTTLTSAKIVNLYAPNSVFGDRFKQLDVAVNKSFNIGGGNMFNTPQNYLHDQIWNNFDFDKQKFTDDTDATWNAAALYVNYAINDQWRVSVRGEYLDDKDGFVTGAHQTLKEGTVTVGYSPLKNFELRAEFRYDKSGSSTPTFFRSRTAEAPDSDNLSQFALQAVYKFSAPPPAPST